VSQDHNAPDTPVAVLGYHNGALRQKRGRTLL